MKVILDTCTFIWLCLDDSRLSERAKEVFQDPANEVLLSSISSLEIAQKYTLKKLKLPEPPEQYVPSRRNFLKVAALPLSEEAALLVARLPPLHRDPFDRLLVAQAITEGCAILTPDPDILQYAGKAIW